MMNRIILKHTLFGAIAVMLCLSGMVSCSQDEPVAEQTEKYTLSFQLTTDGIFSRADDIWSPPHNDDDEGTAFDKTIASVDIFLLGEDNALTRLYALEKPGSQHVYTCQVDKDTPGVTIDATTREASFSGKIMALVNVEDMSPIFSSTSWSDDKIPYSMKFGVSDSWYIPMWGINTFDVTLTPDEITDLGNIHVLRAVSKIVIKLDQAIQDDYKIDAVVMAEGSPKFFGKGYTLPEGGLTTSSTLLLNRENCFDPFVPNIGANEISNPYFKKNSEAEVYTYVSESETVDGKPFAFDVTLKSKKENLPDFKGTLKFSRYSITAPAQAEETIRYAVRNHIYEFTLNLAQLELLPSVKEWVMGGTIHIDMQ